MPKYECLICVIVFIPAEICIVCTRIKCPSVLEARFVTSDIRNRCRRYSNWKMIKIIYSRLMLHNLYYKFLKMLYCLPPYILHKVVGGGGEWIKGRYELILLFWAVMAFVCVCTGFKYLQLFWQLNMLSSIVQGLWNIKFSAISTIISWEVKRARVVHGMLMTC